MNIRKNLIRYIAILAISFISISPALAAPNFNSLPDLKLGDTNVFVKEIQKVLNNNGFTISNTGSGSIGYESNYFGSLTKKALTAFQLKYGISPATGYFGAKTKAKVQQLFAGNQISTISSGTPVAYGNDTCSTISQYGITWTFAQKADKTYPKCGQFATGDWWVIGPVTINDISPKGTTSSGSMIGPDVPGSWNINHGFDSRIEDNVFDQNLNIATKLPYNMDANKSLISSISSTANTPRYQLSDQAILTTLSEVPLEGGFRPTYFGSDKKIKWYKSDIKYSKLSKAINSNLVNISAAEGGNTRPLVMLGMKDSYKGTHLIASNNQPYYGGDVTRTNAYAALALNSNLTDAQKEKLAIGFIQKGIDIYEGVARGNYTVPGGGYPYGYKTPLFFAAVLLGDSDMLKYADSKAVAADGKPGIFAEDRAYYYVDSSDLGARHDANMYGLSGGVGCSLTNSAKTACESGRTITPYTSGMIGMPEWGNEGHDWYASSDWGSIYRDVTGPNLLGVSLAVQLMGAENVWNNRAFFDYMNQRAWPFWSSYYQGGLAENWANKAVTTDSNGNYVNKIEDYIDKAWVATRSPIGAIPNAQTPQTAVSSAWPRAQFPSNYPTYGGPGSVTLPPVATTYTLTTTKAGTGSGTINGASASYTSGATATLTAIPATGSTFTGWSGACSGTGSCSIAMTSNKSVTATFTLNTVTPPTTIPFAIGNYISVTGSTVNIRSSGSTSGAVLGTQVLSSTAQITEGPVSANGYVWWNLNFNSGVDGWAAQDNLVVTATGTLPTNPPTATYTLTTTKAGTGSGTINGASASYTSGATATLTAIPATGSTFTGWSGACSGTGTCSIAMTSNKSVTATFTLNTVTPPVTGSSMLLSVNPNNKRYFQDATGKTVYLSGNQSWSNGLPNFNSTELYNTISSEGINHIRMWRQEIWYEQYYGVNGPYNKASNGKYDLTSFNQAYFDNIRAKVAAAKAKGIYVTVVLADGWWVRWSPSDYPSSPYNSNNNNSNWGSTITINDMHTTKEPYFSAQLAYTKKVLETLKDMDNVMYEVGNEMPDSSAPYATKMIDEIKKWENSNGGLKHIAGVSSSGGGSTVTSATGISNNYLLGTNNSDWIGLGEREGMNLVSNPALAPATKPNIADTDHSQDKLNDSGWPWRVFMRGHNTMILDSWREEGGTPSTFASMRSALGQTRYMSEKINLAKMIPSNNTADCSTGYCLKDTVNDEYLAYNSSVSAITVKVNGAGNYDYFIYSPTNVNTVLSSGTFTATPAMSKSFATVSGLSGGMVVHVKKNGITPPVTTYTLTTTKAGTGSGTINGASTTYTSGATATLTASAASGSTFTGWSGACSGTDSCTVTMDASKNVTATFTLNPTTTYTLTTSATNGTITKTVNGNATTATSFNSGTVVNLTATPASGYVFSSWSGACTGTGTCSVTMSANKTVTASFTLAPTTTYTLTTTTSGNGSGTISGNSSSYSSGATATLTASAASGSTFTGWSGACSGTGSCSVVMNSAKSVTATFTLNTVTPPTTTSGTKDDLLTISGPTTVEIGKTYDITVTYDATQQREVIFELYLYGTFLAGKRVSIPAGSGQTLTTQITVPNTSSLVNKKILYQAYMVPTGLNYQDKKDIIAKENISVIAAGTSIGSYANGFMFMINLMQGISHPDVKNLQKFLNSNGYTITMSGVGSVGNESTYFGQATKAALIKYQMDKGITPASGYFGEKTRGMINGN